MPEPLLHVVLYRPEIPLNTGSIGRTCVAAGAKLWLVRPLGFRLDDRNLRRAGLDYWHDLDWQVADDWPSLEAALAGRRWWFTSKRAARSLWQADFGRGDVVVLGGEGRGLPEPMLAAAGPRAIRIPMDPRVRSLNLANAASIVIYEALRQLSGPGA
ncbi:MAG: tRNA (cytidine(34)-2'-O)-methyltransferase [Pirellulales bacterium]